MAYAHPAQLGVFLGAGAVVLALTLGSSAVPLVLALEFVMPVFICLQAQSNLILLSLIPNALWNCWVVFIQAPRSPCWAGWSSEWKDALITFGVGVAASSIVWGLFIWRRNATLARG